MGIDSIASVQSRIAAIESRIAALNGGGRPPVAITESSASTGNSLSTGNTAKADSSTVVKTEFSTALKAQMAKAAPTTSVPSTGAGVLQGVPGTAEAFVEKLKSHLGVPYVWGGTNPQTGLDCSGLVQVAAREVGVNLPRVTWDQQNAGQKIESLSQAKPGDLLITRGGAHVAVFLGEGKAIHAPRPGKNVQITSVSNLGPIKTIRRVMPSASEAGTPTNHAAENISVALGTANNAVNTTNNGADLTALGNALGLKNNSGLNPQQLAQVAAASTQLSGLGVMNSPVTAQSLLGRSATTLGV